MPRINLLPWRAEQRQERKKQFFMALGGAAIVAVGIVYLSKLTVEGWITNQSGRNTILTHEIAELDKQIEEIKGLENQRERLIARMKVIGELQRSRPEVVHLFDEIVKAVPEGIHLTEVKQTGNHIELQGMAQSSTRVSTLMRNIDSSPWLTQPELVEIKAVPSPTNKDLRINEFTLNVQVKKAAPPEEPKAPRPPQAGAAPAATAPAAPAKDKGAI